MPNVGNPGRIARLAIAAAWLLLIVDAALTLANANTIRVLGGFGGGIAPLPALRTADRATGTAGLLYLGAYVIAATAIGRWVYVTNRNAQAWSAFVAITPGWNVGWFFVPVAGLFKPFQGVRETYQASVSPEAPASVPVPAVMRWWWGAWVVSSIHGNISFQLSRHAQTPDDLIAVRGFDLASFPVSLVLTVTLASVIRRTTAVQQARRAGTLADIFD